MDTWIVPLSLTAKRSPKSAYVGYKCRKIVALLRANPLGWYNLNKILLIDEAQQSRVWISVLIERLQQAGYTVGVAHTGSGAVEPSTMDRLLAFEAKRVPSGLARLCPARDAIRFADPDLVIDLTGRAEWENAPVLQLLFSGHRRLEQGVAGLFGTPPAPELTALIDGTPVGLARPMLDDRVWLTRMTNNLLAAAITLILQSIDRVFAGTIVPTSESPQPPIRQGKLTQLYFRNLAHGLSGRLAGKLLRRKPFYWQVAYRVLEGPGIAETARLDGPPFTVLGDDGLRFYADPFLFAHEGRTFLFVEEFPYGTGKGIISVAEWTGAGFGTPRPVLEESHHLSYPQVFGEGDDIFMLPEGSGGGELMLYRATAFPDRWEHDTVLLSGREINDATLYRADGRYWLFCTERFSPGSASDTLMIFHAEALRGPWIEHKGNPITVDSRAARPGGTFIGTLPEGLVVPVQDGSRSYGGGLGLMAVTALDEASVTLGNPRPIAPGPAWDREGIHTLNRVGAIEVVDSAG